MPSSKQLIKTEALRKQVKGLIEYQPTVEELARSIEGGRLSIEDVPARLRKFIPSAEEPTMLLPKRSSVLEALKKSAVPSAGLLGLGASQLDEGEAEAAVPLTKEALKKAYEDVLLRRTLPKGFKIPKDFEALKETAEKIGKAKVVEKPSKWPVPYGRGLPIIGGGLIASQLFEPKEAEASGLMSPINLVGEAEASEAQARGLQPPISLPSAVLAQPLGEEAGGLQPPIQLGGGPLAQARELPEGLPPRPEGLPPWVEGQPIAGERPIDLVQREPGLYALPEEKMRADIARQAAIERGEVLREIEPESKILRHIIGEGPTQALLHPAETITQALKGNITAQQDLADLGREVSKNVVGFKLAGGSLRLLDNLGVTVSKMLIPKLIRTAVSWGAFQLPYAMTREEAPEISEESVAHAIMSDPSMIGVRPNRPGPPSPADVAEDVAWTSALGVGLSLLGPVGGFIGKIISPIAKGTYRAFRWPLSPLKPYWGKVADLAWESHSIPTIAGIGATGAVVGALTSEDPLEGALKGAGLTLGGKALIESGHLPNILARKLTQVVQGPKGLTTEKMFKTLGETFQPAIERMRKVGGKAGQIAATFRNARVQETFTKNLSRDVQEVTKDLLPSERIEFMRGLSGTPSSKLRSTAAQAALQEIDSKISRLGLQPLYEDAFRKQFGELMAHPLEQATSSLPLRTIMSYTKQFERKTGLATGQVTYKQAQNLLDEIITHPTVNPEMKKLAVQLYDMTAMTPIEAAKASSHAMETFLVDKLVKNPGVVSPVMKLGFVESIYPKTKGMYVSRDLELELEGMMKMHRFANDLYQKFFLTPWKTNKVILRPAAHFRNIMSNVILNDWGGLPFWRQDVYLKSLNEVLRKGPLFKEFTKLAGDTRFATSEEFFRPLANAKYGDSVVDMIYRIYDGAVSPARSAYAAEETWAKLAKYIHSRELGMGKVEAATDAVKWTFNYQEVTPAIARLRTAWWGAPFATWTSKAIPLTAETAVKHPLRFGKWIALGYYLNGYALNQIGMSEEEWEGMKKVMPDYIGKSLMLMLPYRGSEGELKMLNLTWMIPGIGDLAEIVQKGEESPGSLATIAFQNPVSNILAAWKLNKKFGGAPIWHDWESYPTQAAKMLNYAWQQFAPAVLPGGADWNAMYDALTGRPEAPSPEEALAGQFGLKVTTISPEAAFRRKAALDKIYRAEIMQEMRRQLRFARSPEEQEEIVKSAQENLMRLAEEEEEED